MRCVRDAAGNLLQNRLYHVNDSTTYDTLQTDDINDQGTFNSTANTINDVNNYKYDEIGNLICDSTEEISQIEWTVYGKIKSITRPTSSSKDNLRFDYDASGNRIAKHVYDATNNWKYTTYYVRDAQGNVMSVYDQRLPGTMSFKLIEQDIYGSSRIGLNLLNKEMISPLTESIITHVLGKKQYELSNHLGNVLTVVSDRRIPVDVDSNGVIDFYVADIQSATDYYPFGVVMSGRNFTSANGYRYGFNGKENDNEVKGNGNSLDFGARIYDPRIGRLLSIDPLFGAFPSLSPYSFANNNPLFFLDISGKVLTPHGTEVAKALFVAQLEKGFSDKICVSINNGVVELHRPGNKRPLNLNNKRDANYVRRNLDRGQQVFVKELNGVISDEFNTHIHVVENSDKVKGGNYQKYDPTNEKYGNIIDLTDASKLDLNTSPNKGISANSLIAREVTEAFDAQKNHNSPNKLPSESHAVGVKAQENIEGVTLLKGSGYQVNVTIKDSKYDFVGIVIFQKGDKTFTQINAYDKGDLKLSTTVEGVGEFHDSGKKGTVLEIKK